MTAGLSGRSCSPPGSDGPSTAAIFGGGIYIENSDGVSIEGSAIDGNTAGTSGGGVYIAGGSRQDVLVNVTIRGNSAGSSGGGIYNGGGPLTLTDVTFRDNTPDDCFGC